MEISDIIFYILKKVLKKEVTNKALIDLIVILLVLFITQFIPFLGLYRLLPIYIGKIPIRRKNLGISFSLVLYVPPSPS